MSESHTAIPMNRSSLAVTADVDTPSKPGIAPDQSAEKSWSKFIEGFKWAVSYPAMLGMFLIGRVFCQGRVFVVNPDVWWQTACCGSGGTSGLETDL